MPVITLEQAIPRFRANENRVDIWVNGGAGTTFLTSTGVSVPSIRKFLADMDSQINLQAGGILAQASAQAVRAEEVGFRFLTPKATDPTTRDNGSPLQPGDAYWNTTTGVMRTRVGSSWVNGVLTGTTPPQFDNSVNYATTAFVQRALGNYQRAGTIAGNVTLTADDTGECVVSALSSPATVTLPAFATVPSGGTFTIINTGTAVLTVNGGGTNIDIGATNLASISVPVRQSVTIIKASGTSIWHVLGVSMNAAQTLAPIPVSTAALGQFLAIAPAVGAAAILPTGGDWAYCVFRFNAGAFVTQAVGVAAGGTTIGAAVAGHTWTGFAYRISE